MTVYFLGSSICLAEKLCKASRAPANFVPDDDVIIVPAVIEKNFIDEFHEKHKHEFYSARKTLSYWLSQEQYAKDYGLEDTGIVILPTPEQKEQFFRRNYLRFITKDVERTTNSGIQNTWDEWNSDDEIDSIKMLELHEKVVVKAKRAKGAKVGKTESVVKIGEDSIKFGMQVRPEIGMVNLTMKSKVFNARAWLGANGSQEVKLERRFTSTGSTFFLNYYVDESRLLSAFDQKLSTFWVLRFTHYREFTDFDYMEDTTYFDDNKAQLMYSRRF